MKPLNGILEAYAGILTQIWILTLKNLIIIWRSKLWFIGEMILAILFFPIIIIVVMRSNSNVSKPLTYDPVRITGTGEEWDRTDNTLSRISGNYCMNKRTLAYTGNSSMVLEIIQSVESRLSEKLTVKRFETVEAMRYALKQEVEICGKYLGGVQFITVARDPDTLNYRFLFPLGLSNWHISEFWQLEGPYDASADVKPIPQEPPYWNTGLLSIQYAIEHTFLKMVGKTTDFDVELQRLPTPAYRANSVVAFLKATPTMWMLVTLMIVLHTTKNVVVEKDDGIKTYMMIMGLKPMAFYASHFVIGFGKIFIVFALCAGAFSFGLEFISPSMFFVYSLLLGASSILFSIFVSTFVRRPSAAITCACVLWIGLLVAMYSISVPLNDISACMLYSLNPLMAFNFGVQAAATFESTQVKMGWLKMFSGATSSFTFGHAFVMLIVDSLLLLLLIYYLDAVVPTDDSPRRHPLFFIEKYISRLRRPTHPIDEVDADEPDANIESERCMNNDEADINIHRMTKTWVSTGQMAVDNLSFRAYRGQVSVLLGHNGAGKSTTFSVMSGAVTCSSGDVLICGDSITQNTRVCQQRLGYCPQYNPLFPKLTVHQHLKLYAKLRIGAKPNFNLEEHIRALVKDVQLTAKMDTLAENLSGGMKRKLCVAIALVADSPVVLLDEPTAGMDPEARNDISTLLERVKKNKTILLTTHYMDEADKLGNRIGIMVRGRLACNGSPEFLKTRFGTGYVLSAVVCTKRVGDTPDAVTPNLLKDIEDNKATFDATIDEVLRMIRKHAPEARKEKINYPQFSINIPVKYKPYFANMFEELEAEATRVGINSYGLSFNTLEQVFLKVGENCDKDMEDSEQQSDSARTAAIANDLFNPGKYKAPTTQLWLVQILCLLQRCYLNSIRNPTRLIFTTAIVIVLLIAMGLMQNNSSGFPSERGSTVYPAYHYVEVKVDRLELTLTKTEAITVPLQLQSSLPSVDFPFVIGKVPKMQLASIAGADNLTDALLRRAYDAPPLGVGAAVSWNMTTGRPLVRALFNGAAHHAPPMAMLLLSNAILKKAPDAISLTLEIYHAEKTDTALALLSTLMTGLALCIIVMLAFSLVMANFVIVLVEDRQRKFKHQMLLTRMSVLVYWLANILWCFLVYSLFCLMVYAMFWKFSWMHNYLMMTIFLTLFFWSCVPMIFVSSFLFSSPDYAFNALIIGNMVLSTFIMIIVQVLHLFLPNGLVMFVNRIGMVVFPSFSLGKAMILINTQQLATTALWDYKMTELAICMGISGLIFWTLLFLFESRTVAVRVHRFMSNLRDNLHGGRNHADTIRQHDMAGEDVDVSHERTRLQNTSNHELALAVRGVYKYYGRFCAVKNLTFGIGPNDCFGLLGVNGAGKTTTFDMLTGLSYPDVGTAVVNGVNIVNAPVIGYCPQFDSLPFDLTPREALLLLARISGFGDAVERVEKVLWSIRLKREANKQICYLSGGQKRRVSIGVTMVSRARLIMLDEPTAGIDPRTRRHIWNLLQAVRLQNIAIMLTSHSMDECEALCGRIGFMNRGSMISIGTSQHLKSRYGNSFMLTFTIANPNPATFNFLDTLVVKEFKALPTQDTSSMRTLHWEVPKTVENASVSWSQMFRRAQTIADSYKATAHLPPGSEMPLIKDYSITQNSLEQVFLRLAEMSEPASHSQTHFRQSGGQEATPPPVYETLSPPGSSASLLQSRGSTTNL